ncbi:Pal1 cell morphology protein-domain-containing protein [Lipomyces tetrasporus]
MAFASNNPFRAAVLPHPVPKDPAPLPMSPSHSAPPAAFRAPSFNSKNPFLDVLGDTSSVSSNSESVLLRRSTSDSSHENIRPLSDLLFDLSVKEEGDLHSVRPPPPPPRSNRRQNLHAEMQKSQDLRTHRSSESSTFDSHAIIEAYMPLDRDNRPRETPLPPRHLARNAPPSRYPPERRRPPGNKVDDPFATPPSATSHPKYNHRHASSTPAVAEVRPSSSRDRVSRRDHDDHRKSRPHGDKSTSVSPTKRQHHHHTKSSSPTSKSSSLSKKHNGALDKIDKLDVTGIFGTGFHHDGPFDACNPHRNKNKSKAPMLAFPIDSENNAVGAPRHLDTKANGAPRQAIDGVNGSNALRFDPVLKADPVHGNVSLGLGSSTFLEGTPASRAAIMQQMMRAKESEVNVVDFSKLGGSDMLDAIGAGAGVGLTRKKSIVQKIIGMNNMKEKDHGRSHLPPINVAAANSNRSRSLSDDGRKGSLGEVIFEEDNPSDNIDRKSPAVLTSATRMLRQASSPGSTVSSSPHTHSPTSPSSKDENGPNLLKRVRSLKVGGRKRAE